MNEYYHGHFGKYFPNQGYMHDFMPYRQSLCEYKEHIEMFKDTGFINGNTKSVDFDFSFLFPSTSYFVNVNILFEFSL